MARALATEPDVLLLDEPFSALDTHLRSEQPPIDADDYHLQAEVFKEKWERLSDRSLP